MYQSQSDRSVRSWSSHIPVDQQLHQRVSGTDPQLLPDTGPAKLNRSQTDVQLISNGRTCFSSSYETTPPFFFAGQLI